MSIILRDAVNSRFNIKVYGVEISDGAVFASVLEEGGDEKNKTNLPKLAMIYSYKVGNYCNRLPMPVIMVVWGSSNKLSGEDNCANGIEGEQYWVLPSSKDTAIVDFYNGNVVDLLDDAGSRGVDGGIGIENPKYENGKICATVHAWAEIKILGKKIKFDERIPLCIPLEGCYPIFDFGFGDIKACFKAPSELCVKLCVGKWGLSKCWDACVHIPLAMSKQNHDCKCAD